MSAALGVGAAGVVGAVQPAGSTEHFVLTAGCAPCHDELSSTTGEDLQLARQWQTSVMAHAFVDPFWRAKVRTEILRIPSLAAAIEAKCATCHAPMATTEAVKAEQPVVIFGSGFVDPDHPYHAVAMEGAGCTLCHQIQDAPDLGTPEGASGHFTIADASAPDGRRIYGQYEAPFTGPMIGSVDYLTVHGGHVHESEICATCHDLETDYVDVDGNVVSTPETRFPEQMPYREWLHSDYGPDGDLHTPCQGCHMTSAGAARIARRPPWLPTRDDVRRHGFPSANATLLSMLADFADELGISGEGLDEVAAVNASYLADAATVEVVDASLANDTLEVEVRVVNHTGHKLPSGIPVRRVYLHVTVREPSGTVVFESGRLTDDHSIAGADPDEDPSTFEPHHDLITSPDQVQLYEGVLGTYEGDVTYTLLRAAAFLKDNRLTPRGFDEAAVPEAIRPVGACLADSDFAGGSDQVTYRVPDLPGAEYSVDIELRYQPIAYPFVLDLLDDADDPYVAHFARMFAATPAGSEVIDATSINLTR